MHRRQALRAIASASLLVVDALGAAEGGAGPSRLPRVGFLANTPLTSDLVARRSTNPAPRLFEEGLRERGWIDGKNFDIVWRSAEGSYDRLGALAAEMVRMPVDVIVAFGPGVKDAALKTSSIPIVMGAIGAVDERHVGLLSRPDRNITGMTLQADAQLDGKRLSLLSQASPRIRHVAFLRHRSAEAMAVLTGEAASALGLTIFTVLASDESLAPAFAKMVEGKADAVVVMDWPSFNDRDTQRAMHAIARRHRLPVMYSVLDATESGGLMSYAADILDNYRRVPYFVDKILRGAKPSDLPIEQPRRFYLSVNLEAARAIDLPMPAALLAQADRVIATSAPTVQ